MSKGRPRVQVWLVLLLAVLPVACSEGTGPSDVVLPVPSLKLEEVAGGLSFVTFLTAPPGDARLFVGELAGTIRVVEAGMLLPTPFLDLSDRVGIGGEGGLFSVAFHPLFGTNAEFYVSYFDRDGHSRIERYRVADDRNRADPGSAELVLSVKQPTAIHNGGQLAFGPDGKLYIGLGDGGLDRATSQDPGTLLGSLLRIDVDSAKPYSIPRDNPFVTRPGARGEIWAIGLRNPWRFSFDRQAQLLYLTDVGEIDREEVNVVPSTRGGQNYGWNRMEGSLCFPPGLSNCETSDLVLPALEYSNANASIPLASEHPTGCAVIGGYVYRGNRMAGLHGHYFYSDLCGGWLRSFRTDNGVPTDQRSWDFGSIGTIVSLGEDSAGELYILAVTHSGGKVYRIVPAT